MNAVAPHFAVRSGLTGLAGMPGRGDRPARDGVVSPALEPAAPAEGFAARLRAAEPDDRLRTAREAAEQLVATVFVEPILAMLHAGNRAAEPFAPGSAERRFTPFLDQQIAQRIVAGANFGLVDRITEHLFSGHRGDGGVADEPPVLDLKG